MLVMLTSQLPTFCGTLSVRLCIDLDCHTLWNPLTSWDGVSLPLCRRLLTLTWRLAILQYPLASSIDISLQEISSLATTVHFTASVKRRLQLSCSFTPTVTLMACCATCTIVWGQTSTGLLIWSICLSTTPRKQIPTFTFRCLLCASRSHDDNAPTQTVL